MCELEGLRALDVRENKLKALAPDLGSLAALETLDAADNRLSTIPMARARDPTPLSLSLSLSLLSLARARARPLARRRSLAVARRTRVGDEAEPLPPPVHPLPANPQEFEDLTRLKSLRLAGNRLRTFPPNIYAMASLTELDLSRNRFVALPWYEGDMELMKRTNDFFAGVHLLSNLRASTCARTR